MICAIDHIVILVSDLDSAIGDYRALGFTVMLGGEHTGGATHNALVIFADDTYLELIAFKRAEPGHRWWRHVAVGAGLVDFALLPSAIEQDIADARGRGLLIEGPLPGGRLRPDGRQVGWQLGSPPTPDLPFLCGDVTPRELRVPLGEQRRHPNGAAGVAGLTIAVADLEVSTARYRALLGHEPLALLPAPPSGARVAAFEIGGASITLAMPDGAGGASVALRARLDVRGEGPYALTLRADPSAHAGPLDPTRTHGVPIALVAA